MARSDRSGHRPGALPRSQEEAAIFSCSILRRSILASLAVGGLVLGATACSKNPMQSEAQGNTGAPGGSSSSGSFLATAGQKTTSQGTGKFSVTFESLGTARGDVEAVSGSGQFDNVKNPKQFQLTMDLSGFARLFADSSGLGGAGDITDQLFDEPIELVGAGDDVYTKSTFLNSVLGGNSSKPWVKFNPNQQAGKTSGNPLNGLVPFGAAGGTSSFLDPLQGASDDVQDLGTETIDGVSAHHYRATIDPSRARAKGIPNQFGDQSYPEDVWIDDAGVVRRVQYEIDPSTAIGAGGAGLGALGGLGGLGGSDGGGTSALGKRMRITMNITDAGQPVDIRLPSPEDVGDAAVTATPGASGGGGLPPIPGQGTSAAPGTGLTNPPTTGR